MTEPYDGKSRDIDTHPDYFTNSEKVDVCPECGFGKQHTVYKIGKGGIGPKSMRSQKSISIENVEVKDGDGNIISEGGVDMPPRDDMFFTWVCVSDSGVAYQHRDTFNHTES